MAMSTGPVFRATEDLSEKRSKLFEAWTDPDRPSAILPTYQLMDESGKILNESEFPSELNRDSIMKMYRGMVQIHEMDKILYDIQRQGLISFYMTAIGEEATHFGSAQALDPDDVIFAQYREVGVIFHRGFTVQDLVNQCFSNEHDLGKGRQMPVHYGSAKLNFQTISSPLATQIPQATGAGYALKLQGKPNCVICYFGDGAASEGDFHPALNFAATLDSPTIFFCRNNKWAISTPSTEQYRGDAIGGRGVAYGLNTVRVDGNDIFAVYNAVKHARKIAVERRKASLIEAMTYRVGHHSTSDDYTRYRSPNDVSTWVQGKNPITRLFMFLKTRGWITDSDRDSIQNECRQAVVAAMKTAEAAKKPHLDHTFTDVYDQMPKRLEEQRAELMEHLKKYGDNYHLEQFSEKL